MVDLKATISFFQKSVADITESVDSLYRDGTDTQYMQYLSKCRIISLQIC